jgi:hypothetical protein
MAKQAKMVRRETELHTSVETVQLHGRLFGADVIAPLRR